MTNPEPIQQVIDRVMEIDGAATSGPWESSYLWKTIHFHDWVMTANEGSTLVFGVQINLLDNEWAAPSSFDIEAITAYRTDAPRLASELTAAMAEVERLREERKQHVALALWAVIPQVRTALDAAAEWDAWPAGAACRDALLMLDLALAATQEASS